MSDRKLVKDKFDCLTWDIEGKTIDETIEYLEASKTRILNNPIYISAEIAFYPADCYEYEYKSSDKEYIYTVGVREENDKEYDARIAKEKEYKSKQEVWEKQQLDVLKKKYELDKK